LVKHLKTFFAEVLLKNSQKRKLAYFHLIFAFRENEKSLFVSTYSSPIWFGILSAMEAK
jgi:hypothetical protein